MQQKGKKDEEKNLIKNIIRKPIIINLKSKKMNLKELQKMIKEEFDNFIEQEDEIDVTVDDTDIDALGGEEMGGDSEGILRNIYDMLTAYFEAGEGGEDMEDLEATDDVEGEEEEEADIEENATKEAKYQKTGYGPAKKGSTKNAPYTKTAKGGGSTKNAGYDGKSQSLKEVKRLKQLANIIK
jgi:hypothetical protein